MDCKKCNSKIAGYHSIKGRRLVPGLSVVLCIDCLSLFEVEALKSPQYLSLCIAESQAGAAIAGGQREVAARYTRDVINAKRSMMAWTLEWLENDPS